MLDLHHHRRPILCWFLALAILLVSAGGSDPRWVRATAAVYQMLLATETKSHESTKERRKKRRFSGSASYQSPSRLTVEDFERIAREFPLEDLTKSDRRRLDANVWRAIQGGGLATALHLFEQWGPEGKYRLRNLRSHVAHVETCNMCRTVYEQVTQGSQLSCGSDKIGYQVPQRVDTANKWSF